MPRPGRPTTERAKDFKGTLRQLLAAMSRYKLPLIVVVVFAILSTIFNIAGPKILAKATTALATGWIAPSCAGSAASTLPTSGGCCSFLRGCICSPLRSAFCRAG